MISFALSDEQRLLQETARAFARDEVAPLAKRLRTLPKSEPRTPHARAMFDKGAALGFTRLLLPEEHGGLSRSCVDAALLYEELAAADIAITADYFVLAATVPLMIARGGTDEQKARLLPHFTADTGFLMAGAQSEPNVGGAELMHRGSNAALGPKTLARKVEGGYVLDGQKSAFITNGGAAQAYVILARTDLARPVGETLTIFYVPADSEGLSFGADTQLIGWKSSHHAPVYLDQVFVPEANRIGAEGGAGMLFGSVPEMPILLAATFVGLARHAYEYALDYASQRISGGVPIIEHQTVAMRLADMSVDVEAARLVVWDAAFACQTDPFRAAVLKSPAAKTLAVDTAIRNAERAVQILGGYGVAEEYDAGAMLQDAWVGWSCDFTRDVLRLGMVPFLGR